jgi:formate dehydrogenase major subunit
VLRFTDASFLLDPNFQGPADLDGLFLGLRRGEADLRPRHLEVPDGRERESRCGTRPCRTLNCVFQQLQAALCPLHAGDWSPSITGCPQDLFLKVAQTFAATGKPGKAGTILYAMGQTQHTVGSQNVRAMAILQLLLGNIGVAGGGVNALRGESNVQGSTDMGVLFHTLPGYLPTPTAAKDHPTLKAYLADRA